MRAFDVGIDDHPAKRAVVAGQLLHLAGIRMLQFFSRLLLPRHL